LTSEQEPERWEEGVFRVDDVIAGGDWGEHVAYLWSATESGNDAAAVSGFGFARLQNSVVTEE
jgi:hypothetical protein